MVNGYLANAVKLITALIANFMVCYCTINNDHSIAIVFGVVTPLLSW